MTTSTFSSFGAEFSRHTCDLETLRGLVRSWNRELREILAVGGHSASEQILRRHIREAHRRLRKEAGA